MTLMPPFNLRGRFTFHSVVRGGGDGQVSSNIAPHSLLQQIFIKIYYVSSTVLDARIKWYKTRGLLSARIYCQLGEIDIK